MTLQNIIDFSFQHSMGELTPVAIFTEINEFWCGLPEQEALQTDMGEQDFVIVIPTSAVNHYRSLQTIVEATSGIIGMTVRIRLNGSLRDIIGLARGATPDGAAKALVLQV